MRAKQLPPRPCLEQYKKQAKDLIKQHRSGDSETIQRIADHHPRLCKLSGIEVQSAKFTLADAQLVIAREHAFETWAKFNYHINSLAEGPTREQLGDAADRGDIDEVRRLVEPGLCDAAVLAYALARATCMTHLAVAEYLVDHGANVNGAYSDDYGPVILASCEFLNPDGVRFLLDHGASPNLDPAFSKDIFASPLRMVFGTYVRSPHKHEIVEMLVTSGAKHDQHEAVMAIHQGRNEELEVLIEKNPDLVDQRFGEVDYLYLPLDHGSPTLLHIAADYNEVNIGKLLLAKGADINAPATVDVEGIGGQTPIYHTVASWTHRVPDGACKPFLEFLLEQAADFSVKANVRFESGASSCEGQTLNVTPLEFALKFQNGPSWRNSTASIELLRKCATE